MTTSQQNEEQPEPRKPRKPRAPKAPPPVEELQPLLASVEIKQPSQVSFFVKAATLAIALTLPVVAYKLLTPSKTADVEVATSAESAALVFKQKYLSGLSKLYSEGSTIEHTDLQDALEWLKPKKDELIKDAFVDMAAQLEQINGDSFTNDKKRQVFEGFSKGLVK